MGWCYLTLKNGLHNKSPVYTKSETLALALINCFCRNGLECDQLRHGRKQRRRRNVDDDAGAPSPPPSATQPWAPLQWVRLPSATSAGKGVSASQEEASPMAAQRRTTHHKATHHKAALHTGVCSWGGSQFRLFLQHVGCLGPSWSHLGRNGVRLRTE